MVSTNSNGWFEKLKNDPQLCLLAVQYGEEVRMGPWLVVANIVPTDLDEDSKLRKKAVESWEALMNGNIVYFMKAPLCELVARPLVFVSEFGKQSRPLAWKSTDMRLQSTLPLLGNDEQGVHLLAGGAISAMVKVHLRLDRI